MDDRSVPNLSSRVRRIAGVAASLVIVALAVWAVHAALREYRYESLRASLSALPTSRVLLCLLLCAGSYCALAGYDLLAARYIRGAIPWRRSVLASFTAYSVGNNVGFGNLAGSSIRYRLYSSWG